jgi:Protein of unknown function (DUF3500)
MNTQARHSNIRAILLSCVSAALVAALVTGCGGGGPAPTANDSYKPTPQAAPPVFSQAAQKALAQPFKGITNDGNATPGLYKVERTGISTAPIKAAGEAFLAALSEAQRARVLHSVDHDEWRKWHNIHRFPREGVSIAEMSPAQRERAYALLRTSLSVRGFENARDIMRLNHTVAEMTQKFDEYGEAHYWFTVMGTPSDEQPWGWQLDGHHLAVNYFVLRDQIVMTPTFMGSEPVYAAQGKYAGTRVFKDEEAGGLALMRALDSAQRSQAIVGKDLPGEVLTAAYRDNVQIKFAGIRFAELNTTQQALLLKLVEVYVGNIRPGHAQVRLDEVRKHLAGTYFGWIGGTDDDSVFYYRIHSPVILIEFDHQSGIAFRRGVSRDHIHTVVRTPNGNDYGKDLLRQHYEQFDHSKGGHSPRKPPAGANK